MPKLVEDEQNILKLGKLMLERLGYTVLTANTPDEAIRLARDHAGEIHLLMTDVIMPEMNGRDLARQVTDYRPNLKILFMSGYTANVIEHHGVLDVELICKAFTSSTIYCKTDPEKCISLVVIQEGFAVTRIELGDQIKIQLPGKHFIHGIGAIHLNTSLTRTYPFSQI